MKKLYVALDFPTWEETKIFLEKNQLFGVPVKVGMELFYREGIDVIEFLRNKGHDVFLDLKLYDIPTTVRRALENLAKLDIDMINVHALGGSEMIKRAKEGLTSVNHQTKLIAVTILTSMDDSTVTNELRLPSSVNDNVIHLAEMAKNSGADGVVCSVHEVQQIKNVCSADFLTVTPGIRLKKMAVHDQKRIASPQLAKEIGADCIVVGRSITQAENPFSAYKQALKEWNNESI